MSKLMAEGIFKFQILDHGIKLTKDNELPMWVADFRAIAMYDSTSGEWSETFTNDDGDEVNFLEADLQTRGHFVLANKDGEDFFHVDRLTKATPWDGQSFRELAELALSEVQVIGATEEGEYNGNATFNVNWIDHIDADPVRKIDSLEADALDALDAKFGRKKATTKGAKASKPKATAKKNEEDKPKRGRPTVGGKKTEEKEATPTDVNKEIDGLIPDGDLDIDGAYSLCVEHGEKWKKSEEDVGKIWIEQGERLYDDRDPENSDECKTLTKAVLGGIIKF